MDERKKQIGIDAVTVIVDGKNVITECNDYQEKRNGSGNLYLTVKKTAQGNYVIVIVLPSVVRPSNATGFSTLDAIKLDLVTDIVRRDLQTMLGVTDLSLLSVKSIEVNANKEVGRNIDPDILIKFLARVTLQKDFQTVLHVHGKNVYKTIKKPILDGYKSARDSSGRFYQKFYRKDRQMSLEGKIPPLVRLELIYTKRGVNQALEKSKVTLKDVLTENAMKSLIMRYIQDVQAVILPQIRQFLDDAVDIVLKDLRAGEGAYKVFLKHQDVIQYDYKIMRVAMKRFFISNGNLARSAQAKCSRIKRQAVRDGIVVSEGTVKELSELFREIRSQKI